MIARIRVMDSTRTAVKWWPEVAALNRSCDFEFGPGLNILWGPNGSGKSTMLKAIARIMHAEQGGRSIVTPESVKGIFLQRLSEQPADGLSVYHDGQAVLFFDPEQPVGLCGGGSYFDDDFFDEGVRNVLLRDSSGRTTALRLAEHLADLLKGRKWPEIEWRIKPSEVNSVWRPWLLQIEENLRPRIPAGPPTALLDEPDRSFDLPHHSGLWKRLREAAKTHQIIAATHSVFALNLPEATYLDLESGYLQSCRQSLSNLLKDIEGNPCGP